MSDDAAQDKVNVSIVEYRFDQLPEDIEFDGGYLAYALDWHHKTKAFVISRTTKVDGGLLLEYWQLPAWIERLYHMRYAEGEAHERERMRVLLGLSW
jgi:hypothetical protein